MTAGRASLAVAIAWGLIASSAHANGVEEVSPELWIYDSNGHCDPFIPLVRDGRVVPCDGSSAGASAQALAPQLGGILWDAGGRSIALINGTEKTVGDEVNGYLVTEIRRDEVVLTRDDDRLVLRISFEAPKPSTDGETSKGGGRP